MRRGAAGVAALLLLALASLSFADGVVLPSRALVKPVRTPDQRALVAFDGTTETLVVETTLQGEGSEFAWIVPLPAAPKVEASTAGLFPTLEIVTAPRVVDVDKHSGDPGWRFPAAIAAALVAAYVCSRRFGWLVSSIACGLVLVAATCVASVAVLSASKSATVTASPNELSRQRVGAFDVATVDPGDGSGLRRWLDDNGFVSPAAVDVVAVDYARRGWVFVAAKLHVDGDAAAVRRVHPLAFKFPAKEAVYPMRLTLAANPSCALELFACGAGTAEANGVTVAYSGPWHDADAYYAAPHSEVARFATGHPMTKLTGTLDAANCPGDLALRWAPFREVLPEVFTVRAAAERANEAGAWTALVAGFLVSIAVGSWRRGPSSVRLAVRVGAYAAAALAACLVCYARWSALPLLPADAQREFESGGGSLGDEVERRMPAEARADAASASAWMASWVKDSRSASRQDAVPREEDSPGNYTIREKNRRLEFVTYDVDGNEYVTALRGSR